MDENLASQLVHDLVNFMGDASDLAMPGTDTAFDLLAALATCATGDGYCGRVQSDSAKKDAAAAGALNAIMNGDAW